MGVSVYVSVYLWGLNRKHPAYKTKDGRHGMPKKK